MDVLPAKCSQVGWERVSYTSSGCIYYRIHRIYRLYRKYRCFRIDSFANNIIIDPHGHTYTILSILAYRRLHVHVSNFIY